MNYLTEALDTEEVLFDNWESEKLLDLLEGGNDDWFDDLFEDKPVTDLEYDYTIEEPIGRDTRRWVRNTTIAPFRYICNLEYEFPTLGTWAMCSGTLIGPRTVLTAGHCLVNPSGSLRNPKRMRIIPGRRGTLEPLPATQATKFTLATGYSPSSPTDYGIVHLKDKIGNKIGYWSLTHNRWPKDPVGTSILSGRLPLRAGKLRVNVSGYPADKPSAGHFGCRDKSRPLSRCRHSSLNDPKRNHICGTHQFRSFNTTVALKGGMLHYLNDTCPGHSGSPVWVKRHSSKGGRVLVAVHVAGDDPNISGIANRSVFIDKNVRDFILKRII